MQENQSNIHHDIALKDIVQSNSMMEAFYSIAKYRYLLIVSGRKHNNIKIDSFEPISLFFLSADALASPKERKANYFSKFIQFIKIVCFQPNTNSNLFIIPKNFLNILKA